MYLVLQVLEDGADKLEWNQALDLFVRKLELFSRECPFSMEYSEDPTLVG